MASGLKFTNTLERLADPTLYQKPVDAAKLPADVARDMLRDMVVIRTAEEILARLVEANEVFCPCHLGIGQEAVPVGISHKLTAQDRIFGAHRSHSHYLALGGSAYKLFAEVLGRETGASKGMGGSMHLYAPQVGFHGSVPIVSATIPIAAGAALASKMDGGDAIAVSYFGDGAAEEGSVHETLNLAATMQLPLFFVCENNLFSSHLDIHLRQPQNRIARYAEAHDIPSETIDGNDVVTVANTAAEMIAKIRSGGGPQFLEAVTYRHRGHVGPNEDIDVGVRRRLDELLAWKKRDPVLRFAQGMRDAGYLKEGDLEAIQEDVLRECENALAKARKDPFPPVSNVLSMVYRDDGT